ncbi:MAG: hypothetical protein FRX48_08742 [Lasallia pustulata]|uniref:Uncharacterized protein n=1 Tax=Lasallia pustulata TaxID=136370 RepID=A0A5M8PDT8_9LECA|nr:MAG: hypothetical protein FRX48_08742 [Lasallia pustulata]
MATEVASSCRATITDVYEVWAIPATKLAVPLSTSTLPILVGAVVVVSKAVLDPEHDVFSRPSLLFRRGPIGDLVGPNEQSSFVPESTLTCFPPSSTDVAELRAAATAGNRFKNTQRSRTRTDALYMLATVSKLHKALTVTTLPSSFFGGLHETA